MSTSQSNRWTRLQHYAKATGGLRLSHLTDIWSVSAAIAHFIFCSMWVEKSVRYHSDSHNPRLDHSPPAGDLKYHDLIICADLISEADDLPQRMPDAWKCSELICHLNKAEAQHHWDVMSLLLMFNVGLFHFWISNQCESIQMLRPHVNSFSYLHNCFFHLLEAWYWWDGHARDRLFIEHHWFPQTA